MRNWSRTACVGACTQCVYDLCKYVCMYMCVYCVRVRVCMHVYVGAIYSTHYNADYTFETGHALAHDVCVHCVY